VGTEERRKKVNGLMGVHSQKKTIFFLHNDKKLQTKGVKKIINGTTPVVVCFPPL